MASKASLGQFQRALDERYEQFRQCLAKVIAAFATQANDGNRVNPAKELLAAAKDLHDYLAEQDRPAWLKQILGATNKYVRGPDSNNAHEFLRAVMETYTSIGKVITNDHDPETLDFDALFTRFRDEQRLPELFDELIIIVGRIIASGEVDSIAALTALQQIVDLLRANRNGSFLAMKEAISVSGFLKNLAFVLLEKVPVVSELMEAYDRTSEQAAQKLAAIDDSIKSATLEDLRARQPIARKLPDYHEREAKYAPLALPRSGTPDPVQEDVVDADFTVEEA